MTQITPTSTMTQTASCTCEHGTWSALFSRHTLMSHAPHWLKFIESPSHLHACVVLLDLHLPPFLLRPVLHRLLPLLCPDAP